MGVASRRRVIYHARATMLQDDSLNTRPSFLFLSSAAGFPVVFFFFFYLYRDTVYVYEYTIINTKNINNNANRVYRER